MLKNTQKSPKYLFFYPENLPKTYGITFCPEKTTPKAWNNFEKQEPQLTTIFYFKNNETVVKLAQNLS